MTDTEHHLFFCNSVFHFVLFQSYDEFIALELVVNQLLFVGLSDQQAIVRKRNSYLQKISPGVLQGHQRTATC